MRKILIPLLLTAAPSALSNVLEYHCNAGSRAFDIEVSQQSHRIRQAYNKWHNYTVVDVNDTGMGMLMDGYVKSGVIDSANTQFVLYIPHQGSDLKPSLKWVIYNANGTLYDVGKGSCRRKM